MVSGQYSKVLLHYTDIKLQHTTIQALMYSTHDANNKHFAMKVYFPFFVIFSAKATRDCHHAHGLVKRVSDLGFDTILSCIYQPIQLKIKFKLMGRGGQFT